MNGMDDAKGSSSRCSDKLFGLTRAVCSGLPASASGLLTGTIFSFSVCDDAVFSAGLVERFQSSNHMGCPKRPHSVDGKSKMQLSGFMESVV
jgi:hypothetical protein